MQNRLLNLFLCAAILGLLALPVMATPKSQDAILTFPERVDAQIRLDRLRYENQVAVSLPFERAISRAQIEAKVTRYLRDSYELETLWGITLSQRELNQ